ncbi:hypothetical protein [Coraliomargarita akajimensis]|uniref:Rod shape-determining protein MreD n=1 Tax=Coraliomargarita akajimensis (strain DSM 45221 / IAM 15411 / JCM 23193 / KCTC 12865 / 04OKA010-24) TaxID=583355 RepID=D5EKS5_CORAD|nr:hypothetical protein [Coraliomargarita akajimensis]ADE54982.1 hypothetical protein Caka_1964 [Coraliomargarita akajimensis DSM 45221]
MYFDPRGILFFMLNAVLLHLSLMVNTASSAWSIQLILVGPMLVLPALYMRHSAYFLCTLFTGLWLDAAYPTDSGLFTIGLLGTGAFVFSMRMRFRAENNYHPNIIAHITNAVLFLLLILSCDAALYSVPGFWIQTLLNAGLSHLALLLIAPWFFNLQRLLLEVLHLDPEPEDLPLL